MVMHLLSFWGAELAVIGWWWTMMMMEVMMIVLLQNWYRYIGYRVATKGRSIDKRNITIMHDARPRPPSLSRPVELFRWPPQSLAVCCFTRSSKSESQSFWAINLSSGLPRNWVAILVILGRYFYCGLASASTLSFGEHGTDDFELFWNYLRNNRTSGLHSICVVWTSHWYCTSSSSLQFRIFLCIASKEARVSE